MRGRQVVCNACRFPVNRHHHSVIIVWPSKAVGLAAYYSLECFEATAKAMMPEPERSAILAAEEGR